MNNICVRFEGVSKKFRVLKRHKTTFRFIKSLINREPLYRDLWALKGVSFDIKRGETIALIGDNGSGKSTLLRLLTGIYENTSGCLEVNAEIAALFNIGAGFLGDLSVWDNVFLYGSFHGVSRGQLNPIMHHVLKRADLHGLAAVPFKELSNGQKQRLGLSIFFETKRELMVFDESLSNVDAFFKKWCLDQLKTISSAGNRTLLIVSHDMEFLKEVCQKAVWLNKGEIVRMGPAAEVIGAYLASKKQSN